MQLIVTIDTEADDQWRRRGPTTIENIEFVPPFQDLCGRFNVTPTYLCTYEVVSSSAFDRVLVPFERTGRAEIGAHLHPWTTPPLDDTWDRTSPACPYPSEIPTSLFRRKLETLTAALEDKRGQPPTCYRAGRWGFSAAHIEILLELGYVVDCSVTPLLWWEDAGARERGQDFREAPVHPYYAAWGDPAREGSSRLVEVPVTVLHTNGVVRRSKLLAETYRRYRKTFIARGVNRVFRVAPQWFRPFQDMTADRLLTVYETARRLDLPVIQMAFHSSELMPGASPYNQTPDDVSRLLEKLERVFRRLAQDGVVGTTLTGFARTFREAQPR
jgi:hypothetical protein